MEFPSIHSYDPLSVWKKQMKACNRLPLTGRLGASGFSVGVVMRKNFALLGATLVVCLVARPVLAAEKDVGNAFRTAALELEKTDSIAVPEETVIRAKGETTSSQPAGKPAARKITKKPARKKKVRERLVAKINLSTQTMDVLVDGQLRYSWKVSTGRKGFHTPTGSYKPYYLNSMHYSKKYDNAPMPHSVFYSGGFAVHGTYAVKGLGAPASHGCTRLAPQNAKTFFNLVMKYKKAGTRIRISGQTPAYVPGKTYARKKLRKKRNKSWSSFSNYGDSYVSYRARPATKTRRIRVGRSKPASPVFGWQF